MSTQMVPFHYHPLEIVDDGDCCLCKKNCRITTYRCCECRFSVHKECIENFLHLWPHHKDSVKMLPFHDHPVEIYPYGFCYLCLGVGMINSTYRCGDCNLNLHKLCVDIFYDHPIHRNHSFKFGEINWLITDVHRYCYFCREDAGHIYAACTICNIIIDVKCMRDMPPRTISQPKHHEHGFTLLMRLVTFTCNACGLQDDRNPYVCLECDLMVHKECLDLPRVIMSNRHDHRISHTFHLGRTREEGDDRNCGVCRKNIDWVFGAFKCSRCPNYAVHSKCATRKEVWDGVELEDIPEEEEELEDPFKVINENGDIIHISHETENHILLRLDDNCVADMRCGGCVLPIYGDPCYKCMECNFVLHKTCANLPRKKRHLLHNHKLMLQVGGELFECKACRTISNGFRYICSEDVCKGKNVVYDVRCGSAVEPFRHDLHPQHPLYWTLEGSKQCKACLNETKNPLCCTEPDCDYALCMGCTTLPSKVKSRYDDHFLTLSQGVGNASGYLWCDICETKTDPSVCYYTCDDCGVTLHIHCVLGYFYYMKAGQVESDSDSESHSEGSRAGESYEIIPNNGATRPICTNCRSRCKFPFFVRSTTNDSYAFMCEWDCETYLE